MTWVSIGLSLLGGAGKAIGGVLRGLLASEVGRAVLIALAAFVAGVMVTGQRHATREAIARAEAVSAVKDRDMDIGASASLRMAATARQLSADLETANKRISTYEQEAATRAGKAGDKMGGKCPCTLGGDLDRRLRKW